MTKTNLLRASAAVLAAVLAVSLLALVKPAEAAFRGANGKIFFESTRTGSYQIFSMKPNGSEQTNITSDRSLNESDPAVSPNGLKVAYEHAREVWVMSTDGTGKRKVVGNTGGDASPAFSPDGTKIVFVSDRDSNASFPKEIYTINADGSGIKRLTTNGATDEHPDWQPLR